MEVKFAKVYCMLRNAERLVAFSRPVVSLAVFALFLDVLFCLSDWHWLPTVFDFVMDDSSAIICSRLLYWFW